MDARNPLSKSPHCIPLRLWYDMTIQAERDACITVPELRLNYGNRCSTIYQFRRYRMAETVKPAKRHL